MTQPNPPRLPHTPLTRREQQVLGLLAQGLASSAVAARLGASVHTVRKHRSNMLRKLDLPNMAALVAQAARHGYLPSPHGQGPLGNVPRCPGASARCCASSARARPPSTSRGCWG
jgi:DNA-binding CsgD family transcriptional regulator